MEGLENQSLGKYDIVRQIGKGSMGTVYLGNDTFAGRKVAIKVANPDSSKPEKLARRHRKLFFNEAKASGLLRHPNIVAVYMIGEDPDDDMLQHYNDKINLDTGLLVSLSHPSAYNWRRR